MANANNDEHPMLREGLGRLRGRVAIITGANSGIGRATARLFAREGANVVCCDIQETLTPRVDQLIIDEGGEATFLNVNVTADGGPEGDDEDGHGPVRRRGHPLQQRRRRHTQAGP